MCMCGEECVHVCVFRLQRFLWLIKSRSRLQNSISQGLLMPVKEPVDSSILHLEYCSIKKPSRSILLDVRDLCVFNVKQVHPVNICIKAKRWNTKSGKNIFYWQHAKYNPGCCSKQTYTHTHTLQTEGRKKKKESVKGKEKCV